MAATITAKNTQLNISEKRRLEAFLRATDEARLPPRYSYLLAGALASIGLYLFIATTAIAVSRLNDAAISSFSRVDLWMFSTGLLGGATIIGTGLVFMMYAGKVEDRNNLGSIVRKLLTSPR